MTSFKPPRRLYCYRPITWKVIILYLTFLCGVVLLTIPLLNYSASHQFRTNSLPIETNQNQRPIEINTIKETYKIETLPKKKFNILFWAHGPRMLRRFVRSYGVEDNDPFKECTVNNCDYSIDDLNSLNHSDAVLIHLHQTKGPFELPPYRTPGQKWIFFTDESPLHTFYASQKYTMRNYNGMFNWSMTYRSDSDVAAAYGRTVKLEKKIPRSKLPNFFIKNTKGIAVMGSNCGGTNHRWPFIREMQKYISIDTFGACGKIKCAGAFTKDCAKLNEYKFYLAFENSNCREYITEKMWWNAFAKNSVPVVMGGTIEDYQKLCPPHSFIHVENYKGPKELVEYLNYLLQNQTAYNEYFNWKTEYQVLNEHGYFHSPSKHICHICEALNKDTFKDVTTYNELETFWSKDIDCRPPKWKP